MVRVVLTMGAILSLFDAVLCFAFSQATSNLLGVPHADEALTFAYALGAMLLTFAVMFFISSRDPAKHRFMIDMGIVGAVLVMVAWLAAYVRQGSLPAVLWMMIGGSVVWIVILVVVRPKAAAQ